ncbi:TPA: peptidase S24 [Klebsiella pneumoniae]|nr:peptidase S24 [Klebsiella pneumoniae]HBY8795354.1 peptidase S24 [Klebsiella pneumoniae]HBY9608728.1 peptidase S24 [Klebsiella pneumoniae]HBY9608978.1 peptidase S24 [Klebsiella pneumoniae]HBY9966650.1 peptidase S24 [Klebsiella pneumoniae]
MILSPVSVAYEGQTVILSSIVVPAGFPSPASDDLEDEIDPIARIVPHPSATFWWRVSGDSLVDEGIHDGDLIAVDRSGKARVGRIVLAVVDGSITLKKLAKRDGQYWLDPKSKGNNYQPIRITDQTEIWGVIAGSVRRYSVD